MEKLSGNYYLYNKQITQRTVQSYLHSSAAPGHCLIQFKLDNYVGGADMWSDPFPIAQALLL